MSKSAWLRPIGIFLAAATICIAVAGCVSDTGTSMSGTSQWPGDSPTLRYYGGPKSPMWAGQ